MALAALHRLVRKILEVLRCGADRDVALRLHLEDREAALHQPFLGEAEEAVDPGEAARVEDRLLRDRPIAAALPQDRGERGGVERERGEPWRRMAVGRLKPALELA